MSGLKIGVLSIQGDIAENVTMTQNALDELGESGTVETVKTIQEISQIDGLIIPGGESTVIGNLSFVNDTLEKIKEKIKDGTPVLGICAGLILLSKNVKDRIVGKTDQPLLNILDIKVERNSFGRQGESFEVGLSLESLGIMKFNGVFIRAPSISETGSDVKVISKFNGKIVAVKQGNILGVSFHPELTDDISLHKYFVNMIKH